MEFESPHGAPSRLRRFAGRPGPWAGLLLAALVVQGLGFIRESSRTSDEAAHLLSGYLSLTAGRFDLNREEPPLIKMWAALPLLPLGLRVPPVGEGRGAFAMGPEFVHRNTASADAILTLARVAILALSVILGFVLYRWASALWGAGGGLVALALYVLDPNVIAHSGLVTTDLGVTLLIFLTMAACRRLISAPSLRAWGLTGAALGAALIAKYTALLLLPILGLLAAEWLLRARRRQKPGAAAPVRAGAAGPILPGGAGPILAGAVALLVVAAGYRVTGAADFLAGLGQILGHSAAGHTSYFMGAVSNTGWWSYFPVAFAIKTPIGTLVVLALAVLAALAGARRAAGEELLLAVPVLVIGLAAVVSRVNIGLRHILPLYPFLILFAARAWAIPSRRATAHVVARVLVVAALLWNVREAAAIAPRQLTYFNALVGGPSRGHLSLVDSNLDWGQASRALRRFMDERHLPIIYCAYATGSDPGLYGVVYQYVPGIGNRPPDPSDRRSVPPLTTPQLLAISATALHYVRLGPADLHAWMRDRPVLAMPGNAYMVFDISEDDASHAMLAQLYAESGLPAEARREAERALELNRNNELARRVLAGLDQSTGP